MAKFATKQLLDQAVTEGKTYRKDAVAFCKAYRKAITDTQVQVTKMGNEQRKDSAAEAQRESLLQEQVVAASAVTANTPALTSKPASASSAEVLTIFAAVNSGTSNLPTLSIAEAANITRDSLLETMKTSWNPVNNRTPYGITCLGFLLEVMEQAPVASAYGRFMSEFLGSAEYHGQLGRGTCNLDGIGSVAQRFRSMVVMHNKQVILPQDLLQKELKPQQPRGSHRVNSPCRLLFCFMSLS